MALVAGTAYFKVDGVQHSLKGNMQIGIGSVKRESIVGLDGYHGIKQTPEASWMEGEFTDSAGLDLNVLEQLSDVTVQVSLINGKSAVIPNANQVLHLELTADDGKFKMRFEGGQGQWILPS